MSTPKKQPPLSPQIQAWHRKAEIIAACYAPENQPAPAPRTDAAFAKYIFDASPIPFRDFARQLEIENGDLRKRVTLAEAAVVAAHSAMLGKVNPKHPAWGCIYAVQDGANNPDQIRPEERMKP